MTEDSNYRELYNEASLHPRKGGFIIEKIHCGYPGQILFSLSNLADAGTYLCAPNNMNIKNISLLEWKCVDKIKKPCYYTLETGSTYKTFQLDKGIFENGLDG